MPTAKIIKVATDDTYIVVEYANPGQDTQTISIPTPMDSEGNILTGQALTDWLQTIYDRDVADKHKLKGKANALRGLINQPINLSAGKKP